MKKVSLPASNAFCPQCMFLYGTYKENGEANYGMFCWATYAYDNSFKFVAASAMNKLTRDRIRSTGVFSASVVSESLLPDADFCGSHPGYEINKSERIETVSGAVLRVPIPVKSPWSFELEVDKTLRLDERGDSEIYVCHIRNVLADERLTDEETPLAERLSIASPVVSVAEQYFPVDRKALGCWGSWK